LKGENQKRNEFLLWNEREGERERERENIRGANGGIGLTLAGMKTKVKGWWVA